MLAGDDIVTSRRRQKRVVDDEESIGTRQIDAKPTENTEATDGSPIKLRHPIGKFTEEVKQDGGP